MLGHDGKMINDWGDSFKLKEAIYVSYEFSYSADFSCLWAIEWIPSRKLTYRYVSSLEGTSVAITMFDQIF